MNTAGYQFPELFENRFVIPFFHKRIEPEKALSQLWESPSGLDAPSGMTAEEYR